MLYVAFHTEVIYLEHGNLLFRKLFESKNLSKAYIKCFQRICYISFLKE